MRPLVSIVVLNWNGSSLTRQCLESIKANTIYRPFEVIVVDNGSYGEFEEENLNSLKKAGLIDCLILNYFNMGFSYGNNQAFKKAKGELVMMLNNDSIVSRGWLSEAVKLMLSKNRIAAVGCRLVSPKPDSVSRAPCGAAMLLNKTALKEVGDFDALNFTPIYGEETDWCYRARHAGFSLLQSGKSIVVHLEGQDTKRGCGRKPAFVALNHHRLKAMLFNLSFFELLGHFPGLLLISFRALKQGLFLALLKSVWRNIKEFDVIIKERKKRRD